MYTVTEMIEQTIGSFGNKSPQKLSYSSQFLDPEIFKIKIPGFHVGFCLWQWEKYKGMEAESAKGREVLARVQLLQNEVNVESYYPRDFSVKVLIFFYCTESDPCRYLGTESLYQVLAKRVKDKCPTHQKGKFVLQRKGQFFTNLAEAPKEMSSPGQFPTLTCWAGLSTEQWSRW